MRGPEIGAVVLPQYSGLSLHIMKAIQGKAVKVRAGVELTGNSSQLVSMHVATLEVAGRAVRLIMPDALLLSEGDEIIVAGVIGQDGILQAYAYRNVVNGAKGWSAGFGSLVSGLIFTSIGLGAAMAVLFALLGGFGGDFVVRLLASAFASIFMLAFGLGGIRMIKSFIYSVQAKAAVA